MPTYCKIFKSPKTGNVSFQVTQRLLNALYKKARKAKKKGMVVITMDADDTHNYVLQCILTKELK